MTHKKSRTKKPNSKKKTSKPTVAKQPLLDLKNVPIVDFTYGQFKAVSSVVSNSRVMWLIDDLKERLAQGYVFNKWEIDAMDELIQEFNTLYKSPLAKAMREEN